MLQNHETVAQILDQIRAKGIQISLDDFGTGFSSLSYLHQFPIDAIKIDQSFIQTLTRSDRDQNIVRPIVMLAHTLGIITIAEGIETLDQLEILHRMGCKAGQGFFFARPMPLEALDHLCYSSCLQVDEMHSNCGLPVVIGQESL